MKKFIQLLALGSMLQFPLIADELEEELNTFFANGEEQVEEVLATALQRNLIDDGLELLDEVEHTVVYTVEGEEEALTLEARFPSAPVDLGLSPCISRALLEGKLEQFAQCVFDGELYQLIVVRNNEQTHIFRDCDELGEALSSAGLDAYVDELIVDDVEEFYVYGVATSRPTGVESLFQFSKSLLIQSREWTVVAVVLKKGEDFDDFSEESEAFLDSVSIDFDAVEDLRTARCETPRGEEELIVSEEGESTESTESSEWVASGESDESIESIE
ncbi:MAG: hypothetical protein KDK40_01200 [Chlamydiia bacterium]|nr:hypothetical protein [Chlamydiia bacterium]